MKNLSLRKTSQTKIFSYFIGIASELIAIKYFIDLGFTPIKWRYKTKLGELDLIVVNHQDKILLFIEVKFRFNPEEIDFFSKKQMNRIIKTAEHFLHLEYPKYSDYDMRFDFCFLDKYFNLKHIENAWDCDI